MPDPSPAENAILAELKNIHKLLQNQSNERNASGGSRRTGGRREQTTSYDPKANPDEDPTYLGGRRSVGGNFTVAGERLQSMGNWAQKRGYGGIGGGLQSAGKFFETAGTSYVPNALATASAINQIAIQPAQKLGGMSTSLNSLGEATGLSAAGGDISLGPFGMRTPFNAAALEGARIQASILKDSMQAGVTRGQASNIYNQLMGRGFMPDTAGFGRMKEGMLDINKFNSLLGQDPRTSEILDRSTRMGQSSVQDFVETMKTVPTAMRAGRESMSQVVQDMMAFGDFYKKQGGTYAGGTSAATAMMTASGLPGQSLLQLQQSGFVQARQMQQSGLMPWQLGQMDPQQRLMSTMQSVQMLSRQLGPTGPDKISKDRFGFTTVQKGSAKQDATIGMMLGTDAATIANIRENYAGIMTGTRLQEGFQHYEDAAKRIRGSSLSGDQKQAQLEQLDHSRSVSSLMSSVAAKGSGFKQGEIEAIMGEKTAELRSARFNQILAKKRQGMESKDSGPQVLIGLSDESKKYLHIKTSDKDKANANAGNGSTVSIPVPPTGWTQ